MKTITILGVDYTIKYVDGIINDDSNTAGLCDYVSKEIFVTTNPNFNKAEILRHEVVHAFLYESGMGYYAADETLVEWIAIQLPKITKSLDSIKE